MHFSLHLPGPEHENNTAYFRLHGDRKELLSPFYPDPTTAIEAMKQLVLSLRQENDKDRVIATKDNRYTLNLFGGQKPAVGEGTSFADESSAWYTIDLWRQAALATTFPVRLLALDEVIEGFTSLKDLDLTETDQHYKWRETDNTLIRLTENRLFNVKPTPGLQANLERGPCESVFNALQPSLSTDVPLFFGRNNDVKKVYNLLQKDSLLLLYGADRVGKTSLLQCGLTNQIEEDGARVIIVRRSERPLMTTLADLLREELTKGEGDRPDPNATPLALALRLERESTQRIYLVFDQVERLFLPEVPEEERAELFDLIRVLSEGEDSLYRTVLSLRENALAPLVDYETSLPALLNNRYRLLPVKEGAMKRASVNLLDILAVGNLLAVDDSEKVSEEVCRRLVNEKGEVPVHCMQIYLHQLQQKSCQNTEPGTPVPFTSELVENSGPPALLIDEFIGNRITQLKKEQADSKDEVHQAVLKREIEELESSRVDCGCGDKQQKLVAAAAAPVPTGIPWWLLVPLLLVPVALFGYWWFNETPPPLTACEVAEQENSCFSYVNYLHTYGDTSECAAKFRAVLEDNDCEIWRDYQQLQGSADCATYEQFYFKYRNRSFYMDPIRERLLEWGCPLVRDTLLLTVRDTIIERRGGPTTYGPGAPLIGGSYQGVGPDGPDCQLFGTTTFKRIGPLWVMTDALAGGPYRWEDGLDACAAKGYRLPCIGEIDYLLEKIYRDDSGRAFEMLTGTSECYLVNPNEAGSGRVEFWTATEANDAAAWSFVFDMTSKTIERQSATPKSARLPCLCVKKDPEQQGTSLPPCYQKSIRRPE